jgi:hypothetical protein
MGHTLDITDCINFKEIYILLLRVLATIISSTPKPLKHAARVHTIAGKASSSTLPQQAALAGYHSPSNPLLLPSSLQSLLLIPHINILSPSFLSLSSFLTKSSGCS